jgi:predicted nucleotidyltransferase component of viral defense system
MGTTTKLDLSPERELHVKVMRAIAQDVHDLPMVLKGGTALLLCYGLDRFSEDLDFDAPKKFNITGRVERVLSRFSPSFDVKTVKDTETVHRLKAHYRQEANDRLLKIETSFRTVPNPESVVVSDGIRTYRIGALIDQKIDALAGRTKARDLYDVAFLARMYREEFSTNALQKLTGLMADVNAMESRFQEAFVDDTILSVEQLPALVLQIAEAIS